MLLNRANLASTLKMAAGNAEQLGLGKRSRRDEDLDSEFDFGSELGGKRGSSWRDDPITRKPPNLVNVPSHSAALPSRELLVSERDREEWRSRKYHYLAMDAYSRHKALVNQYLLSSGRGIEHFKRPTDKDRNDYSILAEEHKFLWEADDRADTWEKRLAKAYYDKLFKEYAIADLSRYKENKVAMRWRMEKEVCDGKGQFSCGNKHCSRDERLTSWEVNFSYLERGEKKNALVKLRLCRKCSKKLNYHRKCKVWGKKERKRKKRDKKTKHRREKDKRRHSDHSPTSKTASRACEDESDVSSSSDSGTGESEDEEGRSGEATTSGGGDGASSEPRGNEIWKKPAEAFLEKSKADEFEDYFKDMLL